MDKATFNIYYIQSESDTQEPLVYDDEHNTDLIIVLFWKSGHIVIRNQKYFIDPRGGNWKDCSNSF